MSFLNKPAEARQPIMGDACPPADPPPVRDPFAAFFDLMLVVEELCPVWPARETTREGDHWLL